MESRPLPRRPQTSPNEFGNPRYYTRRSCQPAQADSTMDRGLCTAVNPSPSRIWSTAATTRAGSPGRRATTSWSISSPVTSLMVRSTSRTLKPSLRPMLYVALGEPA